MTLLAERAGLRKGLQELSEPAGNPFKHPSLYLCCIRCVCYSDGDGDVLHRW